MTRDGDGDGDGAVARALRAVARDDLELARPPRRLAPGRRRTEGLVEPGLALPPLQSSAVARGALLFGGRVLAASVDLSVHAHSAGPVSKGGGLPPPFIQNVYVNSRVQGHCLCFFVFGRRPSCPR